MRDEHPNARFWIFWNLGWVKVRLKPGQEIHLGWFRRGDEGWSSHAESYEYVDEDGGYIKCQAHDDGRDCDGRLSTDSEWTCPVADLNTKGHPEIEEGVWDADVRLTPWAEGKAVVFDEYAVAAGY